jgi:putative transposase
VAYKIREQRPGFYHVVARGNNKQRIYRVRSDRELFLVTLDRISTKYGWTIYAYCLMRNHYHLVIEIGDRGLAAGMCELNTAYAREFNKRHGKINHLFGKRYWSDRLADDRRLLNTIRYVLLNPRRAGREGALEGYPWSSYAATIGLALSSVRLAKDRLLARFGRTPTAAVARLVDFCDVNDPQPIRRQPP